MIKDQFEHKFISRRIDFIDEYDFDKSDSKYISEVILKNLTHRDDYYVTKLIDLAARLELVEEEMYLKFVGLLFNKRHYLIKLSVLDYLPLINTQLRKKEQMVVKMERLLEGRGFLIVKNQLLLNLMILKPQKRLKYLSMLRSNLRETNNYRSHLRIYNFITDYTDLSCIGANDRIELVSITRSKNFGRSVREKLKEFERFNSVSW